MISLPLNLRGIVVSLLVCVVLVIVYVNREAKQKSEYRKTMGYIEFIGQQLGDLPKMNLGKYRYLQLDSYEYPFELFIGKDAGDFKPKFEQLDKLRVGEMVTVYYYQTDNTIEAGVNRFAQYIYKDGISYYERGNSQQLLGFFMIGLLLVFIAGAILLWKLKKIPF